MGDNLIKNILIIFLLVLVFYLLSILQSILIPFVLAFLYASLFQPLARVLRSWKIPVWLIIAFIVGITVLLSAFTLNIIYGTFSEILANQEYLISRINLKFDELLDWIKSTFGIRISQRILSREINQIFDKDTISTIAGQIASMLGTFSGSFFMFILYFVFLLAGMAGYERYFNYVAASENSNLLHNYEKMQKSIFSYMLIKSFINFLSAAFIIIMCWIFGVQFALFWGFMTFLLLFIPNIGSILAVFMPTFMAFIQFESFKEVLIFLVIQMVVLFLIGNLLEPKIMGNRLRINTLVVLFGLVFWGYLWGIPGMLLSVPLLVILKIVFENTPSLQLFARAMGYPDKAS